MRFVIMHQSCIKLNAPSSFDRFQFDNHSFLAYHCLKSPCWRPTAIRNIACITCYLFVIRVCNTMMHWAKATNLSLSLSFPLSILSWWCLVVPTYTEHCFLFSSMPSFLSSHATHIQPNNVVDNHFCLRGIRSCAYWMSLPPPARCHRMMRA